MIASHSVKISWFFLTLRLFRELNFRNFNIFRSFKILIIFFLSFWRGLKFTQIQTLETPKIGKPAFFELQQPLKLISRKIWVTAKFSIFSLCKFGANARHFPEYSSILLFKIMAIPCWSAVKNWTDGFPEIKVES